MCRRDTDRIDVDIAGSFAIASGSALRARPLINVLTEPSSEPGQKGIRPA